MPKSDKPRKRQGPRPWEREERALGKDVEVHKPAMAPPKSLWRHKGKFALATGTVGGTAIMYRHHHAKRSQTVIKYFNPFSGDTVEVSAPSKALPNFSKAYGTGTQLVTVKRTGRQLSNGTTLTHVRKSGMAALPTKVSLKSVKPGHVRLNANQRDAQKLNVFHGKGTSIKTKSPLKLVRR